MNWKLLANITDPGDQLEWLITTLREAEQLGHKAYIVGHIPPGRSDCVTDWGKRYNAIVDRFEATVKGQFFAHTHEDHLITTREVFPPYRPTGTQWIAPSLTTYWYRNPSFRIFEANKDTFDITDLIQYRMNIGKAGNDPADVPKWEVAYTFKTEYGVADLKPETVVAWAEAIAADPDKCFTYIKNWSTDPTVNPPTYTHELCKTRTCEILYPTYDQQLACSGDRKGFLNIFMDLFAGPWMFLDYD
jgi:sphingomyelin phosphodiesterase